MKKSGCAAAIVIAAAMLAGCMVSKPEKTMAYASIVEKMETSEAFTYKMEMSGQVNETWTICKEGSKIGYRVTSSDPTAEDARDFMFIDDNGKVTNIDYLKKEYGKSNYDEMTGEYFLSILSGEKENINNIIASANEKYTEKREIDGVKYDCEVLTQSATLKRIVFAYDSNGALKLQQWYNGTELFETIKVDYSFECDSSAFEIPDGFTLYDTPEPAPESSADSSESSSESSESSGESDESTITQEIDLGSLLRGE